MRWIIVALVLACAPAHAAKVGVIVTGETAVQSRLTSGATHFLETHGHSVAVGALEPSAISNLLDCLSIDDAKCARGVVEKSARAETILAVRTEVAKGTPREITLSAYWIAKGHSPVSMRRVCEKCSDAALDSTFEAILTDLVRSSAAGRLVLSSKPPGLLAVLDGQPIGTTPLERDVPVGQHQLGLVQNGTTVAQRYISVVADERAEITMAPEAHPIPPPREVPHAHHTRVLPAMLLGAGIAGVVTGGVLVATSQSPTGDHPTYRDTKGLGLGIGIGGAVLAGVGVVLLLRGGGDGPTINVTAGGATAGWIGRF